MGNLKDHSISCTCCFWTLHLYFHVYTYLQCLMGHVLCRFVYSPCLIILSLGNMCGSNSYMQKCFLVPFYVHLVLFLILVLVTFVHSLLSIYILMFTVSISFIFNVAACMFIFFFLSVSSSCYPYGTVFCCFLFF